MSINVSRRWFIGGAASFGALSGCRMFGGEGVPQVTFGIVSDVHVAMDAKTKGIRESHNCDTLVHTLEWFRDQKVDAVMIAGDMADHGMVEEMEAIAKAWFKVFPDDKAPDGRKVERLFVYGNHDWEGFTYGDFAKKAYADEAERAKHVLRTDYAGNWKKIWHEDYAPVWMKTVKGYNFIGAHWSADHCRGENEVGIVGVKEFFAANGKKLDPKLPFFYFQHPHPNGTCYGAEAWGRDNPKTGVTPILSQYSNAVAFSGHSHFTLTDDRSLWQGAYTSIGTASLRYTSVYGAVEPVVGEDGKPVLKYGGYENRGSHEFIKYQNTFDNRQGMLARVYGDHIAISRRDFTRDAMLGDDWVMPLPAAESKPFAFATRAKKLGAPKFPMLAKAEVAKTKAKAIDGERKGKELDVLQLTFPVASAATRPFYYLVEHENAEGKVKTHKILAPGYHRPPKSPEATAPIVYTVALDKLPKEGAVNFRVTPSTCYGVHGQPLTATFKA